MNILKKAAAAGLSLIMAAPLAGCHGSRDTGSFAVPDSFDESRTYEITFWAKNDTNKTQTDIYEKAISDFEAMYPNITVNLRLYTDYGKIYNDVITNIATDTTPNVCITYPDHIATYLTGNNVVVPLDDLMADPEYGLGGSSLKFDGPSEDEIIPQFLSECELQGKTYALPYMRSTEAVYINKDYVEKLGYTVPDVLTWDFIFEVSEAATAKNPDGTYVLNGQNVMIPFIYKSTDNMMIQLLKQMGAGYSTDDGTIEIFNDDTKEVLGEIASHASTGAFSTFGVSGYPANFLNAGQCVFAIDSTAGATWMGTDAPLCDIAEDAIVDFDTEVRMVPQIDPENPQMISQGPSVCIFNKSDPQEVMASWLFAQYLLSDDVQIAYAETEGYVPVTSKAQNNPDYQAYLAASGEDNTTHYAVKIAASKLLLDNAANTFITPVFNGSASLRNAAGQMIEDTVKAVNRHQTVDDAFFEKEFASVTSMYRLDQLEAGGIGSADVSGPLPTESRVLLGALGTAWVLILAYLVFRRIKRNKSAQKTGKGI